MDALITPVDTLRHVPRQSTPGESPEVSDLQAESEALRGTPNISVASAGDTNSKEKDQMTGRLPQSWSPNPKTTPPQHLELNITGGRAIADPGAHDQGDPDTSRSGGTNMQKQDSNLTTLPTPDHHSISPPRDLSHTVRGRGQGSLVADGTTHSTDLGAHLDPHLRDSAQRRALQTPVGRNLNPVSPMVPPVLLRPQEPSSVINLGSPAPGVLGINTNQLGSGGASTSSLNPVTPRGPRDRSDEFGSDHSLFSSKPQNVTAQSEARDALKETEPKPNDDIGSTKLDPAPARPPPAYHPPPQLAAHAQQPAAGTPDVGAPRRSGGKEIDLTVFTDVNSTPPVRHNRPSRTTPDIRGVSPLVPPSVVTAPVGQLPQQSQGGKPKAGDSKGAKRKRSLTPVQAAAGKAALARAHGTTTTTTATTTAPTSHDTEVVVDLSETAGTTTTREPLSRPSGARSSTEVIVLSDDDDSPRQPKQPRGSGPSQLERDLAVARAFEAQQARQNARRLAEDAALAQRLAQEEEDAIAAARLAAETATRDSEDARLHASLQMLTDEETAQRLQEELNQEVIPPGLTGPQHRIARAVGGHMPMQIPGNMNPLEASYLQHTFPHRARGPSRARGRARARGRGRAGRGRMRRGGALAGTPGPNYGLHMGLMMRGDNFTEADYEMLLRLDEGVTQRRVMSRQEIAALPVSKVTGEEVDCTVCLSKVKVGQSIKRLPCSHGFHPECIDPWLQSSRQCPVCKFDI